MLFAIYNGPTFVRLQDAASSPQALARYAFMTGRGDTLHRTKCRLSAHKATAKEKKNACSSCNYSYKYTRGKNCRACAPAPDSDTPLDP